MFFPLTLAMSGLVSPLVETGSCIRRFAILVWEKLATTSDYSFIICSWVVEYPLNIKRPIRLSSLMKVKRQDFHQPSV